MRPVTLSSRHPPTAGTFVSSMGWAEIAYDVAGPRIRFYGFEVLMRGCRARQVLLGDLLRFVHHHGTPCLHVTGGAVAWSA